MAVIRWMPILRVSVALAVLLASSFLLARTDTVAAVAGYESVVLQDNPVGFWRFEEATPADAVADSAPTAGAQDGVYGGTASLDSAGKVGQAMRVVPDGVTGGYAEVTVPFTPSFTSEAWAKSNTPIFNANGYLPNRRAANAFMMHPNLNSTSFRGFVVDSNGSFSQIHQMNVGDIQRWHHYAVSYDDSTKTGRVFVDGVDVGSSTFPGLSRDPLPSLEVSIGRDTMQQSDPERQGDAWIDEVAIYQHALDAAAVERHFLAGFNPGWYAAGLRRFHGPGDLDLEGEFVYALAVGDASGNSLGTIGDATFTGENVSGVSVTGASRIGAWQSKPQYGATTEDDVLEDVMHSVAYSGSSTQMDVELDVIPTATYRLQMLFSENDYTNIGDRTFDFSIDETSTYFDEFDVRYAKGPISGNPTRGVLVAQEFVASDPELALSLIDGTEGSDPGAILGGVTLELLDRPVFYGPDDLNFHGDFEYAIDAGIQNGNTIGQIGDAVFTGEDVAGVTVWAENRQATWSTKPAYGDLPGDDVLETLMHSIAYDTRSNSTYPGVQVDLDVVAGRHYELQLLFSENANTDRSFDIEIEGELLVDEYQIKLITDQTGRPATAGAVFLYDFFAPDDQLNFRLLNGAMGNGDPILNAFTLRAVPEPSALLLALAGWVGLAFGRKRRRTSE